MSTQAIEVTGIPMVPEVSEGSIELIEKKQSGLLARAIALVVNSPETEKIAWDVINGIGELKKNITEDFADSKKLAHAAWKSVCAQENNHIDALKEPDAIVRGKLSAWEGEKRKMQEEEARKAREAAEIERKRLQAIADEQARVEQERLRKEAEDRKIKEALEAEAAGKNDVAAAILNTPVIVPVVAPAPVVVVAPTVVPMAGKVEGSGAMVETWEFTITDESAIPREYLLVNESAIQKVVNALKKNTKIPGVTVTSKWEPRRTAKR